MSELSVRETAARAGYDALNAWAHRPLAEHIADRDPDASLSAAITDAVLAAVADHDGLADMLRAHQISGQTGFFLGSVRCSCSARWMPPNDWPAHLADVVRAWLRDPS